jgi:hypothetical protein
MRVGLAFECAPAALQQHVSISSSTREKRKRKRIKLEIETYAPCRSCNCRSAKGNYIVIYS